ncbi:hypothetical protein ACHAXN_013162 [Cyclotella atomus]
MGWREKAHRAKRLHRPTLKDWTRDGLAATFSDYASPLVEGEDAYCCFRLGTANNNNDDVSTENNSNGSAQEIKWSVGDYHENNGAITGSDLNTKMIPAVLEAKDTPPECFHSEYEARCIPVVIRDVPYGIDCGQQQQQQTSLYHESGDQTAAGQQASLHRHSEHQTAVGRFQEEKKECDDGHVHVSQDMQSLNHSSALNSQVNRNPSLDNSSAPWPAVTAWSFASLYNDEQLRNRMFKVGEDDDGYTVKMKLRHFLRYLESNTDDSPLYIFDATFDEDRHAKRLLKDYTVPTYFNEDLFKLVGERRRPPYRWFLVGPERSGTTVHIDPLGTSAWNTLLFGMKRWLLFPPHVPKSVVKGRSLIMKGEDDEAIHYFTTILPRIKRKAALLVREGTVDGSGYEGFECWEFTQFPGETVFIPHGWWHAVLNITHTVGITQNYCSRRNFDAVWMQTRSGRKKMACTWLRRLNEQYPDLAVRARELNRRDGFVMWEDDPVAKQKWMRKKVEKERKKRESC